MFINTQDVTVGYTGHEEEQTLGLTNMRGRMYDPELGRFTTPDPYIETPYVGAGMNRFSYVLNSPTNTTDPTGFYGNPPNQCDVNCGGGGGGIQVGPLGGGIAIPILNHLINYKNGTTGAIKAKAKSQLQREGASSVGRAGAPSQPNGTTSGENAARFLAWAQTLEEPAAGFVFTSLKLGLGMGGWLSFMPHYVINNYVQDPYEESEGAVGEAYIAVAGSDAYGVAVHSEPFHDELQRAEPTLAALQMVAVATSAAAGAEFGAQALTKQLNKLVRKYGMKRGRFRFRKRKPGTASKKWTLLKRPCRPAMVLS